MCEITFIFITSTFDGFVFFFDQETTIVLYRTVTSDINRASKQKRDNSLSVFLSGFSFPDMDDSQGSRRRERNQLFSSLTFLYAHKQSDNYCE